MRALSKIGIPVALLIGAAAGIAVGWGLGSWTTCTKGSGCELRLDAVNTVVALIGGIGTFVALLIGVITFSRDSREKTRGTILDSRRSAIRMKPVGFDSGRRTYSKVQIEVTNQTTKDMMDISFVLDRGTGSERVLKDDHQVHSGRTFGTSIGVTDVGLEPLDEGDALKIINGELKNRVAFLFDIDGEGFVREGDVVRSQNGAD